MEKKETFLTSIAIDVYQHKNGQSSERSKIFYDLFNLDKQQIQSIIEMIRFHGRQWDSVSML